MPRESDLTEGGSDPSNPLVFSPTDFLETEKAWNFWACNTNLSFPWLVLTTQLRLNSAKGKSLPDKSLQEKNHVPVPSWKYFERLMKVIPLGLADGSLETSFPDNQAVLCWLMRAVAAEEQAIKFGISRTDFDYYLAPSKVMSEGQDYAREILEVYKSGNEARALGMIALGKKGMSAYVDMGNREIGARVVTVSPGITFSPTTSTSTSTRKVITAKKATAQIAATGFNPFAGANQRNFGAVAYGMPDSEKRSMYVGLGYLSAGAAVFLIGRSLYRKAKR